ncbi:YihY/virulence factor BrkB family protein [Humitalea sp. 24SJ18S-53]|uniref:YihY/virulence factor BrkB family protein n=1 Tax=Humitalea sp. 24SJ18S-53 TaxID=3422307 RepID=UPI003D6704FD
MPDPTATRLLPVLGRIWGRAVSDRISLVSAGCAFYAMLALFPALSLLVSVYGLAFDPSTVEPQLDVLRRLLPESTHDLIADRLHELVTTERPRLELGAIVGGAIALWSASAGTRAMIGALNIAYEVEERRGFFRFQAFALLLTLGATLAVAIGIACLVFLPTVISLIDLPARQAWMLRASSLGLLLVLVGAGSAMLYRVGPSHHRGSRAARWRGIAAGSVVATLLWAVGSTLFTFYVSHIASYDRTYGTLGSAVALLMWFYVSVYVVLLGAEVNAAIDAEAMADTGFERPG